MPKFLTDEDFNRDVLRGVLRHLPDMNIQRMQDVGLRTKDDPFILAWAARENYVVMTHDASTMIAEAYRRVQEGLSMPGLLAVRRLAPLGILINDLVVTIGAGIESDFRDQVRYIPL